MNLEQQITEIAERHLPDESVYVLAVQVAGKRSMKVSVFLDGDAGVTIDQCAQLSYKMSEELDALNLIEEKYTLEVSSAGVGEPLRVMRQFKANIGRKLRLETESGNIEGKLLEINPDGSLKLEVEKKEKGKKAVVEQADIPFGSWKSAIVLVSFK